MSAKTKDKKRDKAGKSLKDAMGLYGYMDNYKHIFIPSLIALYITATLSLAFPYFLSKLVGGSMVVGSQTATSESIATNVNSVVFWLVYQII